VQAVVAGHYVKSLHIYQNTRRHIAKGSNRDGFVRLGLGYVVLSYCRVNGLVWGVDWSVLPRRSSGEDVLTRMYGGINCDTKRLREFRVQL
jgi:hypothetical protein